MKNRIFEKFIELSFEDSVNNVSLSKLAKSLGMSKPNLYTYFDSKDALIFEMIDSRMAGKLEILKSVLEEKKSPTERLKKVIDKIIENYVEDTKYWVVFNQVIMTMILKSEKKLENLKKRKASVKGIFTELLKQGKESGEFREDLDENKTAMLVFGMLSPVLKRNMCDLEEGIDHKEISNMIISILFNGIKNRRTV
ncbi:MAG: hypothetical protein C0601_10280 [Candidatus Muiribacterium halophilum]|uniref:HTH tetR-type domain-containing protein n=1 Tax=Muiribacterium halophilum TaxID=2053465 RepID=A0A2N5ZCG5_MUIH1|nr:MAG: hypothetical protein C0601_10280 [Candidatus Muirbacterium halophilum]